MFLHLVSPLIRPKMKRGSAVRVLGLLAFILASSLAWGQSSSSPPSNGPIPPGAGNGSNILPAGAKQVQVSLDHLYWHFFNYQNHLDAVAAQGAQQGQDATAWRNHVQKKLGFKDADYANVRATAQRLQAELQSVDAQAMAIIKAYRAANGLAPGVPPAEPMPPELKALGQQHENLIKSEVANLKSALGPSLSARLDTFLQAQVIRRAPKQTVGHPPTPAEVRRNIRQAIQNQKEAQQ